MGVRERREREKANLREEILDAARTLFVKEGYERASIPKIAEKIEYAPGAIHLYFRDKAEILERLCDETFSRLEKRMQAIHADLSDPLDALRRGLRTYIQFGVDNPNHYIVTFVQAKQLPHDRQPQAGQRSLRRASGGRRALDRGRTTQLRRPGGRAEALWAGAHGVTTLLIASDFPFIEPNRLIDRVVHILIEGIRKR